MDIDAQITILHLDALAKVDKCLKSINIALNLNIPRTKEKKTLKKDVELLLKWKNALEYWKDLHGSRAANSESMSASLGILYEIFAEMKNT